MPLRERPPTFNMNDRNSAIATVISGRVSSRNRLCSTALMNSRSWNIREKLANPVYSGGANPFQFVSAMLNACAYGLMTYTTYSRSGIARKLATNRYLPCRMTTTLRSAGELLDRAVLLDRVGLRLHAGAEPLRRAAAVEQLVRRRPQFLVHILVPPIEVVVEGVGPGSGRRLGGARHARRQGQALRRAQQDGQRAGQLGEALRAFLGQHPPEEFHAALGVLALGRHDE